MDCPFVLQKIIHRKSSIVLHCYFSEISAICSLISEKFALTFPRSNKDLLRVRVFPSRNLVDQVRRKARFEKMPMVEKIPLINSASGTFLLLNNVLYGQGVLRLVGASLAFDPMEEDCGCVIEGTNGDRVAQSRFAMISNSTLLLVPDIPAPPAPWNNEYTVAVSTRYSEHGTRRTGVYRRKLRMPLLITDFNAPGGTGILTGDAASPYVSIIGGTASAQGMVRIQVVREAGEGGLLFSLLDMQEGGEVGPAVRMDGVGDCVLAGFAGSPLTELRIRVHAYADLAKMIRNVYAGRLVDILEILNMLED